MSFICEAVREVVCASPEVSEVAEGLCAIISDEE